MLPRRVRSGVLCLPFVTHRGSAALSRSVRAALLSVPFSSLSHIAIVPLPGRWPLYNLPPALYPRALRADLLPSWSLAPLAACAAGRAHFCQLRCSCAGPAAPTPIEGASGSLSTWLLAAGFRFCAQAASGPCAPCSCPLCACFRARCGLFCRAFVL